MKTKLVDEIYLEKDILKDTLLEKAKKVYFDTLPKVAELSKQKWVKMCDDWYCDNDIVACWKGLDSDLEYKQFDSGEDIKTIQKKIKEFELPTLDELKRSLTRLENAPFSLQYRLPHKVDTALYEKNGKTQGFDLDYTDKFGYIFRDSSMSSSGYYIPFQRLHKKDSDPLDADLVLALWLQHNLIPVALKDDVDYKFLLNFKWDIEDTGDVAVELKEETKETLLSHSDIVDILLQEDTIRADLIPYNEKMLYDIQQGHWSLWDSQKLCKEPIRCKLDRKLVARDPQSSIVDGVVAIDFGTKSTVVAFQENSSHIQLMRVGITDHSKNIEAYQYENPTILEFNDLVSFLEAYGAQEGRPFTKWEDLTISHTALNSLKNSKSEYFNTYLSELKQWAGDKKRNLKIKDKQGYVEDIEPFLTIGDDDLNPIELYAYLLALSINNQNNGIFLKYILSFPVTYEIEIQNKIIDSFKKGIKKSLPQGLHNQADILASLDVQKGASEPAAYAVVALEEYGFDPVGDEKVFYAIFDFGGGTTDFDFGVFYEANTKEQKRYDFVIEHFGAGGDRYLGGENLLEYLAFEIFKANQSTMLELSCQFTLPPECQKFLGSETLLSSSREAKMNTKILMEAIRPYWEGNQEASKELENKTISVNLYDINAKAHVGVELSVEKDVLDQLLKDRIRKGVRTFFDALRVAYCSEKVDSSNLKIINIFLAGNSSKSPLVENIFQEEIEILTEDFIKLTKTQTKEKFFKLFKPLGDDSDMNKPTGKTGVAFGLIKTRKGGKICVINHNETDNSINFAYYLGIEKRKKFKVEISRDAPYNEWFEFIDASEDTFEVYYCSLDSATTNNIPIADGSILKKMLKIDKRYDNANIYIRLINATEFEYVVATQESIKENRYLNTIQRVSL